MILDFYDDKEHDVLRSIFENDRSGLAKTASQIKPRDYSEIERLKNSQFALISMTKEGSLKRSFPVDSPEETWLSSLYFMKTANNLNDEKQVIAACNINHSANIFDIEIHPSIRKMAMDFSVNTNFYDEMSEKVSVKDLENVADDLEKRAELKRDSNFHDQRYWGLSDGIMRYPLKNPEQVKTASEYFDRHQRSFEPHERHEFASKIAARSLEYEMEDIIQMPSIAKYAGIQFGSYFEDQVEKRIDLCKKKKKSHAGYENLIKQANQFGANKCAIAMEHLDHANGMTQYWGKWIEDPYASTFGNQIKQASEKKVSHAGKDYSEADLKSIPKKDLEDKMSKEFCNEFYKDPVTMFNSMPNPEKSSIISMI